MVISSMKTSDCLIDLCIAFEGLFMRETKKQSDLGIGFIMGLVVHGYLELTRKTGKR